MKAFVAGATGENDPEADSLRHSNSQRSIEEYITSVSGNRYFRLNAPPGNLQISYRATVGLSPYYSDPSTVFEVTKTTSKVLARSLMSNCSFSASSWRIC